MLTPALFQILSRSFWLLGILVSTIGFIVSLRRKRQLKMPSVYLCYSASASTIQFIFWLSSAQSEKWYLFFEIVNSLLLFFATVELLRSVNSKKVRWVAIPCFVVVAYAIIRMLLAGTTLGSLEANLKTLLMVLMLFGGLLGNPKQWTRESRLVFTGILLLTVFSSVSSILLATLEKAATAGAMTDAMRNVMKGAIFFSQLSPLPGLILLALAGKKTDPETNAKPEINIDLTLGEQGPKFENKLNKKLDILKLCQALYLLFFQ